MFENSFLKDPDFLYRTVVWSDTTYNVILYYLVSYISQFKVHIETLLWYRSTFVMEEYVVIHFFSVADKALVKWPDILILSHLSRSRQEFSFFILFLEEMEENVSSTDPLITYGILAH